MFRRLLLIFALVPLASSAAFAQSWPTRQIVTVVPQSPGSALDIVTRAVMQQVATRLGQPIVVENRTGAGNTIAMAAVARSEPDGYTILANSSTHSLVPVTHGNLSFDTFRDLAPIVPISNTPLVMVVASSKGYKNVAEFVEAAGLKAN
jgi:tripartite-type tricarboxylate transporter receptor subunit TctC